MSHYPSQVVELSRKVQLLACDVNGVLVKEPMPSALSYTFHPDDDAALRSLHPSIELAIISAGNSPEISSHYHEIGFHHIHLGAHNKASVFKQLCAELDLSLEQAAFIGDSGMDQECIEIAGLGLTVESAHPSIKKSADWVTPSPGGEGALHDVAALLTYARENHA